MSQIVRTRSSGWLALVAPVALSAWAGSSCGGNGAERAATETPDEAQPEAGPVTARLFPDVSHVAPGQEFTLGVELEIETGWFIHWKHPGDAGEPTRVALDAPAGFHADGARFPGPARLELEAGEVRFGYRERAFFSIPVVAPDDVEEDAIVLSARAEWLACRGGTCERGNAAPRIELPVATPREPSRPARAEQFEDHRRSLPRDLADLDDIRIAWRGADDDRAELVIEIPRATDLVYFPDDDAGFVGQAVTPTEEGQALRLWLDVAAGGSARGVIRMTRGDTDGFFRVSLAIPDELDE